MDVKQASFSGKLSGYEALQRTQEAKVTLQHSEETDDRGREVITWRDNTRVGS